VTLEKLFNLRLGAGRAEDDLPDRFTEERVPDAYVVRLNWSIEHVVIRSKRGLGSTLRSERCSCTAITL